MVCARIYTEDGVEVVPVRIIPGGGGDGISVELLADTSGFPNDPTCRGDAGDVMVVDLADVFADTPLAKNN